MDKTFSERVIEAALSIPPGKVATYCDLARVCGAGPMAAQSITTILGRAADQGVLGIPFHRIVYADGRVWKNQHYNVARAKLYRAEGIMVDDRGYIRDFHQIRHHF